LIKRCEGAKDIVYYRLRLTPAGPKNYVFEHFDLVGDDNQCRTYGPEDRATLEILGWVAESVRKARERPHKTQVNTKLIWDTALEAIAQRKHSICQGFIDISNVLPNLDEPEEITLMTSHDGNGYDLYRELILTPGGPKAYIFDHRSEYAEDNYVNIQGPNALQTLEQLDWLADVIQRQKRL
jgi:hypothetical protein